MINEQNNISASTVSAIKKAYIEIRENILLSLDNTQSSSLAIVALSSDQIKATSVINLAIAISTLNKKVLVIDSDTLSSTATKLLNLEEKAGLCDIIKQELNFDDAVIPTKYENFHFLPIGNIQIDNQKLLSSKSFETLLKKLKKLYDYILIDTSPIKEEGAALCICRVTDASVLIARQSEIDQKSFKKAIAPLKSNSENILGIIQIKNPANDS